MTTETHLKKLKHIESNPHISQRKLAGELGVRVGKGQVKAGNFKRNANKMGYLYLLTPQGIEEKAKLLQAF
jgi:hypothetical protein